jgi:2-octaprenyl-6-methoxyphenol hydroxylase
MAELLSSSLSSSSAVSVPVRAGLRLAVIGAGPVGLALALLAARRLPQAHITVFDALPAEHDVSGDPRTLALSLGSVQALQQLGVWDAVAPYAAAIETVHVSQQQPGLAALFGLIGRDVGREPELLIRAAEQGVTQLGAVTGYGRIVAPLRAAWLAACAAEPQRLQACFGVKVSALNASPDQAEVDAGGACSRHDLAVIAEGGVFADQARKGLTHDYRQTAWVGTLELAGARPGWAYERFTSQGPVALLPLPALQPDRQRAALVWCVSQDDDPLPGLDERQRRIVLQSILPEGAGEVVGLSALKSFALGLNAERSLVRGRSVRIGNAAQTLHPVAGQGLNLGLRDAHELLRQLAREPDVDRALARTEWQRAPDRWATIATTDFLARSFTWPLPGLATLRGAGLAAMQHLPGLKSLLARQMMFGQR